MKKLLYILAFTIFNLSADCASFLQPVSFPKTTADLSFEARTLNKAEGYKPYEGLNAYQIIELEQMEEDSHDAIEAELAQQGINLCQNCDKNGNPPPQDDSSITTSFTPSQTSNPENQSGLMRQGVGGYCSLRHPKIPQGQKIPLGMPVNMADMPHPSSFKHPKTKNIMKNTLNGYMCSPYFCRKQPKGTTRPHTGVDVGCTEDFYRMPIYSVADGVVTTLTRAKRGSSAGNYIAIDHGAGWHTQYMHLDEMLVSKGQHVSAGCLIGYMGYTGGNADQKNPHMDKGLTHLHYEILYSGRASRVSTPNGKSIQIYRENTCTNGKTFKTKIKPNDFMTYHEKN